MSADDPSEDEWNPLQDRRRFLVTAGLVGAAGLSGCSGDNPLESTTASSDGSSDGITTPAGGEKSDATRAGGDGDPTSTAGNGTGDDGDGAGNEGDGTGDGDDGETTTTTPEDLEADPESNPLISAEEAQYVLPATSASTTFDAEVQDDAVVLAGDDMDAILDADTASHRYTIDEDALGERVEEGSVILISGVALRRVTSVSRGGSRAVVDTETASLNEAISDGTVGWDAEVSWEAGHSPPDSARSMGGQGLPVSALDVGGGGDDAHFAGVEMVGSDGTTEEISVGDMATDGTSMTWTYTEADREYTFKVDVASEEATITVQVKAPASGDADLAFVAEGTVGSMRSKARADYSDGELSAFDYKQNDLSGEITVKIAAANSGALGFSEIDWKFPGLMFKYVVFAGPVPVTIGIETQIIGNIHVPVDASAEAASTFSFGGEAGFTYEGTSVDADAQLGTMQFDPEPADSAGKIGSDVDAQFGLAFPRIDVSVFDQGIIPYLHAGCTIGSRLTWGPLCKSSYVRFVVQAGYDLSVLGVSLGSDKTTLFEDQNKAYGDSCENG